MVAVMSRKEVKRVICVSDYWPQDEVGRPRTINSVITELNNTEFKLTRHTLEKALEGTLTGADVDTIDKLIALCNQWSGREDLTYDDITQDKK